MSAADIAVVLLAAGLSRRMGQDKLLKRLSNGKSLLEDRIHMVLDAGVTPYVAIPESIVKTELVTKASALPVCVPSDTEGMGVSISAAVRALPDTIGGILIMLSDLPDVTSDDLRSLMSCFNGETILRATNQDGTQGHPVIFPIRYRSKLEELTGDQGAKALLFSEQVELFPLPNHNAVQDLDTPEDWGIWENGLLKNPRK